MVHINKEANMPNIEEIVRYSNEGFSNKDIADKVSTEEETVSYQAVAKIIKENTPEKKVVVTTSTLTTRSAEEYAEYSKSQGRTSYGGEIGVKIDATKEELRAYINSGWRPSMLLEKWQMTEEELTQLTWVLAKAELRDRQPTVNFKQDLFRF